MKTQTGKVRIISGTHKGRIVRFQAIKDLRPTPDRVRETLFNWLTAHIPGSTCLDLFAGSGSLGLEALSRGAGTVQFIESNTKAARCLKENIQTLQLTNTQVHRKDSLAYLKTCNTVFDIIFLDPPFSSNLLSETIENIDQLKLIKHQGWIYIETSMHQQLPELPQHWQCTRNTKAGEVHANLINVLG